MRRALALLAAAGGLAALFATAAQPERHLVGAGWTRTASAACYTTTWTKHFERVTRSTPCPRPALSPPSVTIAPDGAAVPIPSQGAHCTSQGGSETVLTPFGPVKFVWSCVTVSSTG